MAAAKKTAKTPTKNAKIASGNGVKAAPVRVAAAKAKATSARQAVPPLMRRADFVRLAEGRTSRAVEQIRLLGNLSNLSAYDFDEKDVKEIKKVLQKEIAATMALFERSLKKAALKRERKQLKLAGSDRAAARG